MLQDFSWFYMPVGLNCLWQIEHTFMRTRCGGGNGHALMWDATPFGGKVSWHGKRFVPYGPCSVVRRGDCQCCWAMMS